MHRWSHDFWTKYDKPYLISFSDDQIAALKSMIMEKIFFFDSGVKQTCGY